MRDLNFDDPEVVKQMQKRYTRGKIVGGLFLVGAGVLFMARELGAELPYWLFTWKTLLIALGVAAGAKRLFYPGGWLVPVFVGVGFLVSDFSDIPIKAYILPAVLIIAGLMVMFRPFRHRGRHCRRWQHHRWEKKNFRGFEAAEDVSNEDFLESTTVFGAVKKIIFSKSFKGGEVVNVFGGTEINLMQADFEGTVKLEVTQVFGGARLFVPSHWEIRSDVTAVLGSVEDKRSASPNINIGQAKKILVLEGTSFMGGIEIRSI